jgi:polar amino acid transport system substrate-binding protein
VLLPPLAVKDGFFVVSQQFYEQNQALTWQIWRYLAKVNAQDIYQKYLEGKIQD